MFWRVFSSKQVSDAPQVSSRCPKSTTLSKTDEYLSSRDEKFCVEGEHLSGGIVKAEVAWTANGGTWCLPVLAAHFKAVAWRKKKRVVEKDLLG